MEMKEEVIENFVALQDVLSNIAIKLDTLIGNIDKLLKLFAESAKAIQEHHPEQHQDHELVDVMKTLLDQNKIIAKSLSIIEERTRSNNSQVFQQMPQPQQNQSGQPQQSQQAGYSQQSANYKSFPQRSREYNQRSMTPSISPPKENVQPQQNQTQFKPKPLPTEDSQG